MKRYIGMSKKRAQRLLAICEQAIKDGRNTIDFVRQLYGALATTERQLCPGGPRGKVTEHWGRHLTLTFDIWKVQEYAINVLNDAV